MILYLTIFQIILITAVLYLLLKKTQTGSASNGTKTTGRMVIDTSVLIDGRILEVAGTGFITSELIIPKFIVSELQMLADGQDPHKRERARFGLDIVQSLQNTTHCKVTVTTDEIDKSVPTDDRLVIVAKKLSADLCTTDYNLNKVATIEGVRVLNVNELANAMRPVALPGERKKVKIVQRGSNKNQGVGYLEDGSMLVVEGASSYIGKQVDVEISRYIQTDAGKMLFGRKIDNSSNRRRASKPRSGN